MFFNKNELKHLSEDNSSNDSIRESYADIDERRIPAFEHVKKYRCKP